MATVDLSFANEIKKYGAINFDACYNCGTCTAVCNLSEKNASFPRIFVRYAQTGRKAELLSSKELWLCYACGDCSASCPRDADPGELIAALRRYAIAQYEPTGITRLIFKNNPLYVIITLLIAVVLAMFLLTIKPDNEVARWLFTYIPYETIHNMGIAVFVLITISAVFSVWKMLRCYKGTNRQGDKKDFWTTIKEVMAEIAILKRYQTCDTEEDSYWHAKPWFVRPWFAHWTIMWGFVGLFIATGLDFLFKNPASATWWPTRILGTLAGLLLLYGSTLALYYRLTKPTKTYAKTKLADWIFLIFVWITGISGFWIEIAVMTNADTSLNLTVFLIHTVFAMEMFLLLMFSKFAHAIYRPVALYYYFRDRQ